MNTTTPNSRAALPRPAPGHGSAGAEDAMPAAGTAPARSRSGARPLSPGARSVSAADAARRAGASRSAPEREAPSDSETLTIAISSRALFDLEESHRVFARDGVEAYARYQIERENEPLGEGPAFAAVRKLLALNDIEPRRRRVDVALLSRNSVDAGLRVLHSIAWHGLDIRQAAFASGRARYRYLGAFGAQLFLSADDEAVREALGAGYAAAMLLPAASEPEEERAGRGDHDSAAARAGTASGDEDDRELRIAFDGDAVLFSDEAERVYHAHGLETFVRSEQAAARKPLPGGPFRGFLGALHRLQAEFGPECAPPIRTALVTARSAPAHERVIRTLRAWNIRIDEAMFLAGGEKGEFLRAFGADIFFDDQTCHCDAARGIATVGHVPNGIKNEPPCNPAAAACDEGVAAPEARAAAAAGAD